MKKIIALLVVGAVSMSANANNWVYVGEPANNDYKVYLDLDTIQPYRHMMMLPDDTNMQISSFARFNFSSSSKFGVRGEHHRLDFVIADCAKNTYTVQKSITYDSMGNVVYSYDEPLNMFPSDTVFPGTIVESIVNTMCSYYYR